MSIAVAALRRLLLPLVLPLLLSLAACTGNDTPDDATVAPQSPTASESADAAPDPSIAYREQLLLIEQAVLAWRNATTIDAAHAAAEAAANLVVGPGGPGYGDRDANGTINGESASGILPALNGSPIGLANPLDTNACIVADVLGGSWDDPAGRWNTMLVAIEDWRPNNNTMPTLPSHPMRVVGWATFTLASDSLDEAHEYAGHARLHVNVSLAALDC